jgi:lysophospholipase L1-like esterase
MLVVVAMSAVLLAGCGSKTHTSKAAAAASTTTTISRPVRYVAVGASDSVGYGADDRATQAWPVVFRQTALPPSATFENLGIAGITVAGALTEEVPKAVAAQPTLVTVWLAVNDFIHLVSAQEYEQQLGDLVHQLRRGGATKVLVGNTPALDGMPAYLSCLPTPPAGSPPCILGDLVKSLLPSTDIVNAQVAAYNDATARVVKQEGAVLVDLHGLDLQARTQGREKAMYGADGFHPSTAGHQAIAGAFADALRASGGPG